MIFTSESFTDFQIQTPCGHLFARKYNPSVDTSGKAPLILLHDSLGCVETWREFPKTLSERLQRTVIAYDRLGFGKSSALEQAPALEFISDEADIYCPLLLQHFGIKEYYLFGHSVGGAMALIIASKSNHCLGVITEAAQAFVEEKTLEGIRRAKEAYKIPDRMERLRKFHGEKAEWVVKAWTDTWLNPVFSSWSLQKFLPLVRCPVLVIHGDQDEYGSAEFPKIISSQVSGPAEMHLLEGCGHIPHREREGDVIALVEKFI